MNQTRYLYLIDLYTQGQWSPAFITKIKDTACQ